ncbi:MAG: cupin domain-containing protein [Pseudomonadota bacterium]
MPADAKFSRDGDVVSGSPRPGGSRAWHVRGFLAALPLGICLITLCVPTTLRAQQAPVSYLPEELRWGVNAAAPGAQTVVVLGNPTRRGPFTTRVRMPSSVVFNAHYHPDDRVYTVISGIFYIGFGSVYDPGKLQAYPPGAVVFVPGGAAHFHGALRGEWIVQINGIGPTSVTFVRESDDPRL